jgi:adenosylcobinamide kinase/adenosylcobinamide-phosphate guanylyltransferase
MQNHTELILILGGARSGKSTYAEQIASAQAGDVLYVATAQAWDDEMRERIAVHRAERLDHWRTLEAPIGIGAAINSAQQSDTIAQTILVDCLTMLANNAILALPEPVEQSAADSALYVEVDSLLATYAAGSASLIVVSNEVGLGIVPAYPLGRVYRDALGRANQRLAAAADRVVLMVAGLPMVVKG